MDFSNNGFSKGQEYARIGMDLFKALISGDETARKRQFELGYWKFKQAKEGELSPGHYEHFFKDHFDLDEEDYKDKRVLDIGCGPRGSLNWADQTENRVGLDPLANDYNDLNTEESQMDYINGRAEDIPVEDDSFDIVTSFNSLDHVDDLEDSISEIKRVTADDGLFLLITDVNHDPTMTEPVSYNWDIVEEFEPDFDIVWQEQKEKTDDGIYASARFAESYDFSDSTERYGVLSAKFRR